MVGLGIGRVQKLKFNPLDGACIAAFLAYSSSAVVTPLCLVLIVRELDINLTEGGGVEVVRTGLILMMLLLSGFLAARWGKARMLAISSFCLAAGLMVYALAGAYPVLLLGMGLAGLGSGILEGLINPLVQDQHPDDSGRYLNVVNGFWSVGVMATVLIGGDLLTRDVPWRLVATALAGLSCLTGLLFCVFARHEHTHARQSLAESATHFRNVLRDRQFWIFAAAMVFAGGVEMGFTFWSATLIQLWLGSTPRAAGVGTACFAAGMVAGRFAFGHYVAQKHLARLILLSAAAGFCISLFVFAVNSFAALCFVLFLAGLSIACFWPSIQSLAAERLTCDHTMLFILLSCAGIPGCGLASWIMGIISDHSSVRASFAIIPVMFLLLAALIYRADRFVMCLWDD